MKKSSDFYKVVNAVCNTICEQGGEVPYILRENGTIECSSFDCNDSHDIVRDTLLAMADCEELDKDELLEGFGSESDGCEFWQLSNYGEGADCIQLAINPDKYVTSSYKLRDMIADDLNMERAEITEGMNGYPKGLRGCVLINDNKHTFDELEKIAERYGVEIVDLKRKDGWQLWQSLGTAFEEFDYAEFLDEHHDNIAYFTSWEEYAKALREWAYNLKNINLVAELAERAKMDELADTLEKREPLSKYEFVWVNTHHVMDYTLEDRFVDHFEDDTWNYSLAFDCAIDD